MTDTPEQNNAFDETPSRYIVGIDLGTTNCAVAYLDTESVESGKENSNSKIRPFSVTQWVDFGTFEKRDLLPSFWYEPLGEEQKTLNGATAIVGCLARDRGLQMPGRQISSAKSWLCHDGVDRDSPILPWQGSDDVQKLSPVDASASYLAQIRTTWDRSFPEHPLAEQDIVLTLPASFDQVARQLTIEAAARAGLKRILPIEEPQAAFYAWLARHSADWEKRVKEGETILVCDIGGGTTDFTLIRVRAASQSAQEPNETLDEANRNKLSLHRVAVGQHLILGGDNIDLALAKFAEHKLSPGKSLPSRAWDALRHACRVAKEQLLGDAPPEKHNIHLPGSGSRLVGGGQQVEITREEIEACVLDGFFPKCELNSRPDFQAAGFQEFGLPFAADAGITRHLAAFLWDHRTDGRSDEDLESLGDLAAAKPDWILFNGGVMTSTQLCERLVSVVGSWFAGESGISTDWQPGVLEGERLDRAVATGAAYFGQVRRGDGVAIEAKLACSYYLQTSVDPPAAICVVPGSASPGDSFKLADMPFELAVGEPVQFPLAYSSTRLADQVGQRIELNDEHFRMLPPIRTVLELTKRRRQDKLPVFVQVDLTQIGTLQMHCQAVESEHRWKLEFDVRGSTQTDRELTEASAAQAGVLDAGAEAAARDVLSRTFGESSDIKPSKIMYELGEALDMRKSDWPPQLLREIWACLIELQSGRKKSAAHEARWLNLLGYSLRPGYGLAADDWRVAQSWRTVHGKLAFSAISSRNEALILWRRIAGGFTAGQQLTVYQQIASPLRGVLDPIRRAKGGTAGVTPNDLIELLRLVGALELLPKTEKTQIGNWLTDLLRIKKWQPCASAVLWTLGRLGARVPTYGPLNCVVDPQAVEVWLNKLLEWDGLDPNLSLALMLCSRRVHDRYRDVASNLRPQIVNRLEKLSAPAAYSHLVLEGGELDAEAQSQIIGEALPMGLQLV